MAQLTVAPPRRAIDQAPTPVTTVEFAPGAYWTPGRAAAAAADATASFERGGLQKLQAWSERYAASHIPQPSRRSFATPRSLRIRRGELRDIPAIESLLAASDLPPLFVAEYIRGFVVVESDGAVLACGGLEPYGRSGILRSVAVSPAARGLGLGSRVAALLIADADLSGLYQVFLSSSDAAGFWSSLGFVPKPLGEWPAETQSAWQFRFFSEQGHFMKQISLHTMWRPLPGWRGPAHA